MAHRADAVDFLTRRLWGTLWAAWLPSLTPTVVAQLVAAKSARPPRTVEPAPPSPQAVARRSAECVDGPKRMVVAVLAIYGARRHRARVKLECGHVRAWHAGEPVARCAQCRDTTEATTLR